MNFLKAFALFLVTLIIICFYSCEKRLIDYLPESDNHPLETDWAYEYYTKVLQPEQGNSIVSPNRKSITSSNDRSANLIMKKLLWKKAVSGSTSAYSIVEVPIKYSSKVMPSVVLHKPGKNNIPDRPDPAIMKASFDRLIIYKDKKGVINQKVISYVPDKEYLTRHNGDISHNGINKLDNDFDGYVFHRQWNGAFIFILRIENGTVVKRISFKSQSSKNLNTIKTEICQQVEVYEWFQWCYYDGDNPEPYRCDEPYPEFCCMVEYCYDNGVVDCDDPSYVGHPNCATGGEEGNTVVNTDCSSFSFSQTISTNNWQEAGVTNIRLKWVWVGGPYNFQSRTTYIPQVVFGVPTYFTNRDGSTTSFSSGEAAVFCAQAVEIAKNLTYSSFRNSPYMPSDATIVSYFRNTLSNLMKSKMGTAGVNGSNHPDIIFNEEERSNFSDPYDCD